MSSKMNSSNSIRNDAQEAEERMKHGRMDLLSSHDSSENKELCKFHSQTTKYKSSDIPENPETPSSYNNEIGKSQHDQQSPRKSPTKLIVDKLSSALKPKSKNTQSFRQKLQISSISSPEIIPGDVNIKLLQAKNTSIEDFADTSSESEDKSKPKYDTESANSIIDENYKSKERRRVVQEYTFKEDFGDELDDKSVSFDDNIEGMNISNDTVIFGRENENSVETPAREEHVPESDTSIVSSSTKEDDSRPKKAQTKRKNRHRKIKIFDTSAEFQNTTASSILNSTNDSNIEDQASKSGASDATIPSEECFSGNSLPNMDNVLSQTKEDYFATTTDKPPRDSITEKSISNSPIVGTGDNKSKPKSILSYSSGELLSKLQFPVELLSSRDNDGDQVTYEPKISQSAYERSNRPKPVSRLPDIQLAKDPDLDLSPSNKNSPTKYPLYFQNYIDEFRHDRSRQAKHESSGVPPPPRIISFSDKLSKKNSHEFMLSDDDYLYNDNSSSQLSYNEKFSENSIGFQQQLRAKPYHSWVSFVIIMLTSLVVPPIYFMITLGLFDASSAHRNFHTGLFAISQPMVPSVNRKKRFSKTQKIISFTIGLLWVLAIIAIIAVFLVNSVDHHL